jgi:hypothetical protein
MNLLRAAFPRFAASHSGVVNASLCFREDSLRWHAICIAAHAMLKIAMSDSPVGSEPSPQFATEAEVAFAQLLRHQLEQRYLGHSTAEEDLARSAGEIH